MWAVIVSRSDEKRMYTCPGYEESTRTCGVREEKKPPKNSWQHNAEIDNKKHQLLPHPQSNQFEDDEQDEEEKQQRLLI